MTRADPAAATSGGDRTLLDLPAHADVDPGAAAPRATLDGTRGCAIALVLGDPVVTSIVPGGGAGVDLFFVLSGYLMTRLLLAERSATGHLNVRAFYLRRAVGLVPALTVLIAVVCTGYLLSGTSPGAVAMSALWP